VQWSSGYYTGWQQAGYPPQQIPWQAITDLIQFSVMTSPNCDGSIDTTAHSLTPAFMQAAVAEAHQQHRKILLSIGGAEDNNWDAACNATNRATFIGNLVGLLRQHGYDGIDLDIEQDRQSPAHPDYIACVAGIWSALERISPRSLLTEAADPNWQAYMLVQVYQYLDQINLMSYGVDAGTIATDLNNYTSRGIPKTELGVGLGIDSGVDGSNPADCAAKAQYVVNNGYGGVMAWDVAADAVLHNGQTPCFTGIAPYVPAANTAPPVEQHPQPDTDAHTGTRHQLPHGDHHAGGGHQYRDQHAQPGHALPHPGSGCPSR
jgi:GH18 family chitinase